MNDNDQKIITKRSRNIRFLLSSLLGGVGFMEVAILFAGFAVGIALLIGLSQISVWLGLVFLVLDIIFSVFLIVPLGQKKLYQHIGHNVGYWFAVRKVRGFNLEAFNKVAEIQDDYVKFTNGYYMQAWAIDAIDISLMTQSERNFVLNSLKNSLKNLHCFYEIVRHEEPYLFADQTKHILDVLQGYHKHNINSQAIADQLLNFVEGYEAISNNKHLQHSGYYLLIYSTSLDRIRKETQFHLAAHNIHIRFYPLEAEQLQILVNKEMLPGATNQKPVQINQVIQKRTYLKINDQYTSFHRVTSFPLLVNDGWLFPVANQEGVQLSIQVGNVSNTEAIRMLDKAVTRAYMNSTKKASEKIESSAYLDHFHTLLDMIKNGGEQLKMMTCDFTLSAMSLAELMKKKQALQGMLFNYGLVVDHLRYRQLATYKTRLQPNDKKFWDMYGQEIGLTSLASAYPFVPSALNDPTGLLLGFNEMAAPLFFNVKTRNNQGRVNSNCLILGMTGFGKTYNVSKQLNWLYLNHTKLFIIDPEREYHHLARYYGGSILAVGTSFNTRINPLEVFGGDLMLHIGLLEQFFRILYPDLIDRDFADWQKLMVEVYTKHNITMKTDLNKLKSSDYPTFSDVFLLNDEQEQANQHRSTLNSVLWKLAHGADGRLWNGHSTLTIKDERLIVFDTHELSSNKNIQNAQIFLMLAFLDKNIKVNKAHNMTKPLAEQDWICVAIDEAHLLVNENNTLALEFLFQMTKRIRKYNGILYIISQNVNDFIGSEAIKTQSQGIINNCSYQFIHHLAPNDLQDYDNLVSAAGRLNDYQKDRISNAIQGQCLFVSNNQRNMINIQSFEGEATAWLNN